jgi:peptide/nickel transport system substrate-binding protein
VKRIAGALLVALLGVSSAISDEARTLRIGVAAPVNSILYYHESSPTTTLLTHAVFDTLIAYDERRGSFAPLLARAWTRIDDRTIDFEIRDDVTWHDRVALDAEDVLYTLNWLSDPATQLHMQHKWAWIDHAEKLGHHKVRLVAKRPAHEAMARLATAIAILPEHKHGLMLGERAWFGKDPVGTGPYRGRAIDRTGIVLERTPTYAHGGTVKVPSNVERVLLRGSVLPEQTLSAFRAGELDVVLDVSPDDARAGDALATVAGYGILTLSLDARSGPLADARIRRALLDAIDQAELAQLAPGARVPRGLCWTEQSGCSLAAPASSPAAPQQGLTLELVAQGAFARAAAERIARLWRAIGVETRIKPVGPEGLYMRQRDGELQAAVFPWHAGEMPDVAETLATFAGAGFWDRHGDPVLHALTRAAEQASLDAARNDGARRVFDRIGEQAYAAAVGLNPTFVLHRAAVTVDPRGRWTALGITLFDLSWR